MRGMFGSVSIAALVAAVASSRANRIFGAEAIDRHIKRQKRSHVRGGVSIARINRWTGQPHEHKREIARRLRQRARKQEKAA